MEEQSNSRNTSSIKGLTDIELLDLISKNHINPTSSEIAFNEFHRRYKGYLYKVCFLTCQDRSMKTSLATDFTQDTFVKVFRKANTFKISDKEKNKNPADSVKAWIGTIAHNVIKDYVNENPMHKVKFKELDDSMIEPSAEESEERKLYVEAFDRLDEKRKNVLSAYLSSPKKKLDSEVLEKLAKENSVSKDGVRKIKQRAIEEIKRNIEDAQKEKPK